VNSRRQVEVRQRYRTASTAGASTSIIWRVAAIYLPWPGGFELARLENIDARAGTMTLAASVVADKSRFTRVE
jgi:hypothetical protein